MVEEVEDPDSPQNVSAHNISTSPDPPTATEKMTGNMVEKL